MWKEGYVSSPAGTCTDHGDKEEPCNAAHHFLGFHMKHIQLFPLPSVMEHIDLPLQAAKWNQDFHSE